jgi:hypothetical protein
MKRYRSRTTYAATYRTAAPRQASTSTVYKTDAGQGIENQTVSGKTNGFMEPIEERTHAGRTVYFARSKNFADRYYVVCRRDDGTWHFSGEARIAKTYIAQVEAFAAKQCQEVA